MRTAGDAVFLKYSRAASALADVVDHRLQLFLRHVQRMIRATKLVGRRSCNHGFDESPASRQRPCFLDHDVSPGLPVIAMGM
jgi:hypothetical protein